MEDSAPQVIVWLLLPFVPLLIWLAVAIQRQRYSARSIWMLFAVEAVILGAFMIRTSLRSQAVFAEPSAPVTAVPIP